MFARLSRKINNWFPTWFEKCTVLVFLSLIDSLVIVAFFRAGLLKGIPYLAGVLGAYAYLFPVGWLFLSLMVPDQRSLSLIARFLLAIALSIALSNIALQAWYYLIPLPMNVFSNIAIIGVFGTLFFVAWVGRRVKQHATGQ